MKRAVILLLVLLALIASSFSGRSYADRSDYERTHLKYLRQQVRLLERQNDLMREQVAQLKRIADLAESRGQ